MCSVLIDHWGIDGCGFPFDLVQSISEYVPSSVVLSLPSIDLQSWPIVQSSNSAWRCSNNPVTHDVSNLKNHVFKYLFPRAQHTSEEKICVIAEVVFKELEMFMSSLYVRWRLLSFYCNHSTKAERSWQFHDTFVHHLFFFAQSGIWTSPCTRCKLMSFQTLLVQTLQFSVICIHSLYALCSSMQYQTMQNINMPPNSN